VRRNDTSPAFLELMEGDGHLFRPDEPATRAELTVVVGRLLDLLDPPT